MSQHTDAQLLEFIEDQHLSIFAPYHNDGWRVRYQPNQWDACTRNYTAPTLREALDKALSGLSKEVPEKERESEHIDEFRRLQEIREGKS